jgi:beta-carotene 15,15'-dioxygenase
MSALLDRRLRTQGIAFCGLALGVALAATLAPALAPRHELLLAAALIGLLGVPHGAFDVLYGHRLFALNSAPRWMFFLAAYTATSAVMVALWFALPFIFLVVFLLITVLHFSADPLTGTRSVSRFFYGGAIIVLPNLLHGNEVHRLFGLLVTQAADSAALNGLTQTLQWLAWPWLAALLLCALVEARTRWLTACELAAVAALAVLLTPLLAFTVFFCFMHGARHTLRTLPHADHGTLKTLFGAVALVMLLVAIFAIAAYFWLANTPLDARLIQIVFIGLAALTVPHMTLVERVRFRGWR